MGKTLFERIWERHLVAEPEGEPAVLFVDLHLIHEVTSAQAFDGLRLAGQARAAARPVARDDGSQRPDRGRAGDAIRSRRRSSTRCAATARSSASRSSRPAAAARGSST